VSKIRHNKTATKLKQKHSKNKTKPKHNTTCFVFVAIIIFFYFVVVCLILLLFCFKNVKLNFETYCIWHDVLTVTVGLVSVDGCNMYVYVLCKLAI